MAYFKFTITCCNSVSIGIRQLDYTDIDTVHRIYEKKAKDHYKRDLQEFNVVMLSKLSKEVKEFIKGQGKKEDPILNELTAMEVFNQAQKTTPNRKKGYNKDEGTPLGKKV